MDEGVSLLWWLLGAFLAGGYCGGLVMAMMNMASYASDRAALVGAFEATGAHVNQDQRRTFEATQRARRVRASRRH